MYRFKGVSTPQEIYAVGQSIESLQPPPSSEKVKRLGGQEYIKRARDRKFLDWVDWFIWRAGAISFIVILYVLFQISIRPMSRVLIGLPYSMPTYDSVVKYVSESYDFVKEDLQKRIGSKDEPDE